MKNITAEIIEREGLLDLTTRELVFKRAPDSEKGLVKNAIFSTEKVAQVFDWREWVMLNEILLARGMQMASDQIPMLDSHTRWNGSRSVIGSGRAVEIEKASAGGEQISGDLHFSSSTEKAREISGLVDEGHLTDVSVGYNVLAKEDLKVGEKRTVKGIEIINNGTEIIYGDRTFTVPAALTLRISTDWNLKEISTTPIGADDQAKIRSLMKPPENPEAGQRADEEPEPVPAVREDQKPTKENRSTITMKTELTAEDRQKALDETRTGEQKRIKEINSIAQHWSEKQLKGIDINFNQRAFDAVEKGTSIVEFREQINVDISNHFDKNEHIDTDTDNVGLSKKEISEYSILRAVNAIIDNNYDNSLEFEASRAVAEDMGLANSRGKFYVPGEIVQRQMPVTPEIMREFERKLMLEGRALTSASGATGLVGTEHMAANFIEALRAQSVIFQLGARQLTGLVGNVAIPKQSGVSTVEIVAEAGTGTYGDPAFTNVTLTPYDLRGLVVYTRQLLIQSNPSVEALLMLDLMLEFALGIDHYSFQGTGSSQPTGLLAASGVGTVDASSVTWADIVEFETDTLEANARGPLAFAMRPSANGLLKVTQKVSGQAHMLSEANQANGYPIITTTKMPANNILFGAFSQLLLGFWGAMEIAVDPFSDMDNGRYKIRAFQLFDVAVRNAAAFSKATNLS